MFIARPMLDERTETPNLFKWECFIPGKREVSACFATYPLTTFADSMGRWQV